MSESPYHLEVQGFDEVWPVSTLSGREALSATYRFDAVFSVPGSFEASELLQKDARLTLRVGNRERIISGLLERVANGEVLAGG